MKEEMMKPEIDTKPKSKKEKKEEDDPRSMPTKVNLAKNKLRAMGLNMGYEHDKGLVDAYSKVYDNTDEKNVDEAMSSYDRNRKAAAKRAAARNAERRAGKRGGRMERETYRSEAGVQMHHKGYKAREGE